MLSNSLLLRVLRAEPVERPPVWFMRQAGRYLPEYRELRKKHRMLELISNSALAAEVTLQPLRRFQLDAAIIFADILNPLIGMGVELDFIEGEGPKIFNPVSNAADVDRLIVPDMAKSTDYTMEAIKLCTDALNPRGIPLIGFSGAPFTLSSYLIDSGDGERIEGVRRFMRDLPDAWHSLQLKLCALVSQYLAEQARSGVSVLQIFDSWAGMLTLAEFDQFVLPYLKIIVSALREATPHPLIYFSASTAPLLQSIAALKVNAISVDASTPLAFARQQIGDTIALQGNLDPAILAGAPDRLERAAREVLAEGLNAQPFIFNLGHGIIPETPPSNVELVVKIVRGE